MAFISLSISDFRNLASVKLEPILNGFNVIYGDNGSGKTSLLEAIYYLGLGRSFRTAETSHVVREGASCLSLFANINTQSTRQVPLGVERQKNGEIKIRLADKAVLSIAEVAHVIPIQLINSNSYNLIDAGPVYRRQFLDWGVYHANPNFFQHWRRFRRALKQRNAALRSQVSSEELQFWTKEFLQSATMLDQFRQDYVKQLMPVVNETISELICLDKMEIHYQPGWNKDVAYQEVLSASLKKDLQFGCTQHGPHRADLKITVDNIPAKDVLSRGQQKLFVCAMLLAQGILLDSQVNKKSTYLIDDLPSELDAKNCSNLVALLSKQEAQVFITAIGRDALENPLKGSFLKMFHVEHGNVVEIGFP